MNEEDAAARRSVRSCFWRDIWDPFLGGKSGVEKKRRKKTNRNARGARVTFEYVLGRRVRRNEKRKMEERHRRRNGGNGRYERL